VIIRFKVYSCKNICYKLIKDDENSKKGIENDLKAGGVCLGHSHAFFKVLEKATTFTRTHLVAITTNLSL